MESPRDEAIGAAVSGLLEVTGLAAPPDSADYVMDVVIRRNRFFFHQPAGKFKLQSEVFLEQVLQLSPLCLIMPVDDEDIRRTF